MNSIIQTIHILKLFFLIIDQQKSKLELPESIAILTVELCTKMLHLFWLQTNINLYLLVFV